ncbi:MAG: MgtC/SapB family protein [bacterium]|nr:MgtC/SapB family protein [bacterium]
MDIATFFDISPLEWIDIAVVLFCGGIIGFERQFLGKPAGIRTSILICMGTYCFVKIGSAITGGAADPGRVLSQVITGIGFLGAGVMMNREGMVFGVTSAAVIWILAAIGVSIGFRHHGAAIWVSIMTVILLTFARLMERLFPQLLCGAHKPVPRDDLPKDF